MRNIQLMTFQERDTAFTHSIPPYQTYNGLIALMALSSSEQIPTCTVVNDID